jgi:hypothetical protein
VRSSAACLLAAAALAAAAPACNDSGGGSSSSSGPVLTRAEFTSRASDICRSYRDKIRALKTPSDLEGLAAAGEKAVELQKAELAELRRLRPPPAEAADVERMLDAVQRGIDKADDLIAAARDGDQDTVTSAVAGLQAELETANRFARKLSLGDCAITA